MALKLNKAHLNALLNLEDVLPGGMTISNWIAVQDHPRQRNTREHLDKAKREHLRNYAQTWRHVHAAWWKGQLWKLDGHSRALGWLTGEIQRPSNGMVSVNMDYPQTEEEFLALYDFYDNLGAAKGTTDVLTQACNAAGITITSTFLSRFGWTTYLRRASGASKTKKNAMSMYELVEEWADQIRALDGLNFPRKHPYLTRVMLMAIRRDGADQKMVTFFREVFKHGGHKTNGKKDGVQATVEYIDDLHRPIGEGKPRSVAGYRDWDEIDRRVWDFYERFRHNRLIADNIKAENMKIIDDETWKSIIPMTKKAVGQ